MNLIGLPIWHEKTSFKPDSRIRKHTTKEKIKANTILNTDQNQVLSTVVAFFISMQTTSKLTDEVADLQLHPSS